MIMANDTTPFACGDCACGTIRYTFDDPALCPPTAQILIASKLPWVALDPAIPAFAQFYAGRDIPALLGERDAARLRALRAR